MLEILELSASQQGEMISDCKLCPVTLTETYLDQIKSNKLSANVFSFLTEEEAISKAKEAKRRAKAGNRKSKLDGVLVSWKDLFDIANVPTEAGSKLLQGRVPTHNAKVVSDAERAGLISVGKTHMSELAFSGLGVNPMTKTPPNSLNNELAPGGSSSGAAASTSLKMVSGSWGSDTGGSVRVPAAWNNLVGMKSTHGLLSLKGVVPLCPKFDTIGPIVRTVDDAINFLALLTDKIPSDLEKETLRNKKIGIVHTELLENLDNEIHHAFEISTKILSDLGVKLSYIKSTIITDTLSLAPRIFSPEAYGTWKDIIDNSPEKMYAPILSRFKSGNLISGPDYVRAWHDLTRLRNEFVHLTEEFDATMVPTTPILPPDISELLANDDYFSQKNLLTLRNTRLANMMGLPALSLPTSHNFCGLMIMGKPFGEIGLLRLGKAIETKLL